MAFTFNPFTGTFDVVPTVSVTSPLVSTGGINPTLSIPKADGSTNGYLSLTDWTTFNNKAPTNSPTFTGIPLAPTASVGTSTTQIATTAFVLSQGFLMSGSSMPSAHASSTSVVTSATTTYVTAISTTITTTSASAPVYAKATATFTTTTAATVAKCRVSINGVAGQEQLISLTALATNYVMAVQYISANLGPGTYTILFEIARNSGVGTVNFFEGTLDAIGLQGGTSNGITQITGLGLSVGPGSGAQSLTGILTLAGGGTNAGLVAANGAIPYSTASALALLAPGTTGQLLRSGGAGAPTWTTATFPATTTINQILYSSAANVITGLATVNTGALVTSSTGVPSITSGATANRLLRTNGTTVSFAQANLTTDVTGTLPMANGGTGITSFANQRVPFGTGSALATDANFIYDTTNQRLTVGGSGTARIGSVVPSGSTVALQAYSEGTNNAFQIRNNNAYAMVAYTANNTAGLGGLIGFGRSRGTQTARTQSLNGDTVVNIVGFGFGTSAESPGFSSAISMVQTEDCTATANGGEIYFSTTPNGTNAFIERMRIKQSGESVFSYAVAMARYTTTNKNALTPVGGWVVFDTTLNQLSYYNGTTWVNI